MSPALDVLPILGAAFGVVFGAGGACALLVYRVRRLEVSLKKAHRRIDAIDGGRWIETDVIAE